MKEIVKQENLPLTPSRKREGGLPDRAVKYLLLHASCVSINGQGVLLLGESGSGKSDLALRLIEAGAELVADDQVNIHCAENALMATAPQRLQGLLEVRGLGICTLPYINETKLKLAVKLVDRKLVERLPEPAQFDCLNQTLPLLSLHAFDISTVYKIRLWLERG